MVGEEEGGLVGLSVDFFVGDSVVGTSVGGLEDGDSVVGALVGGLVDGDGDGSIVVGASVGFLVGEGETQV